MPECRNAGMPERRNAGTPERQNAGTPERRNTKTRNTILLKPGTHGKKLIKFKQENSPSMPTPGGGTPRKIG